MADPRKPVISPAPETGKALIDTVHRHLLAATAAGSKEMGATGATFVIIGMGVFATELTELDGRSATRYLRSLADIFDPDSSEERRREAATERSLSVRALYAALDLTMAETQGNG